VLFLANGNEIAQMPQFHFNTFLLSIRYKTCVGRITRSLAKLSHETQGQTQKEDGRKSPWETENSKTCNKAEGDSTPCGLGAIGTRSIGGKNNIAYAALRDEQPNGGFYV